MIPLPTMNRICKYWNLPSEFQEACDYYFLRNYSDQDFVSLLSISEDGHPIIQEYGINFQVLFQGDAAKVYTANGERDKRKEPNNTFYWCSFRSLTFEFGGKKETKSFVLVQVDKKGGVGEKRDALEVGTAIHEEFFKGKASGAAGAIKNPEKETSHIAFISKGKTWTSASQALAEYERIKELKEDSEEDENPFIGTNFEHDPDFDMETRTWKKDTKK